MHRIGTRLIAEKKAAVLSAHSQKRGDACTIERHEFESKDLLTLLIKSNMAADMPDNQRLSEEDILAREFLTSLPLRGPADTDMWQRYRRACVLLPFI